MNDPKVEKVSEDIQVPIVEDDDYLTKPFGMDELQAHGTLAGGIVHEFNNLLRVKAFAFTPDAKKRPGRFNPESTGAIGAGPGNFR